MVKLFFQPFVPTIQDQNELSISIIQMVIFAQKSRLSRLKSQEDFYLQTPTIESSTTFKREKTFVNMASEEQSTINRYFLSAVSSVNRQESAKCLKKLPKMISLEKWSILTPYKNCQRMWEIWANLLLPKALKTCPKSNKSPNLVTLAVSRRRPQNGAGTILQNMFPQLLYLGNDI